MLLSMFDLDHTLIPVDSDVLWNEFLVEKGVLSEKDRETSDAFYRDYERGELDISDFLEFQLRPLGQFEASVVETWREEFIDLKIRPVLLSRAFDLLDSCRRKGHRLLIVTATNRFVTTPIAELLGVSDLLATEVEFHDGRYTGRSFGTPCFREGKIVRLEAWLSENKLNPVESWFYTDSRNDIPLLEKVDHPVAVDPDPVLLGWANERHVPVISLR